MIVGLFSILRIRYRDILGAKPPDLTSICTRFVVCAKKQPAQRSFLHQLQLLHLLHTTALLQRLHHNKHLHLQIWTGFPMISFRYCAPVAITIVRAEIRAPLSSSIMYGLRSQMSRVAFARSICAPNF